MVRFSVGVSEFFIKNSSLKKGNSFTLLTKSSLIDLIKEFWDQRVPGTGEGDCLTRKVLVPLPVTHKRILEPVFFLPPRMQLVEGMPVKTKVVARQKGEKPFIETFITIKDAKRLGWRAVPAEKVMVVCYSAEALLENNGTRSTTSDWEIVTLLCSKINEIDLMVPLTMARNKLEKEG